MTDTEIPRVVFLCVHNAGRSQMAAGFARHIGADRLAVSSGGSKPGTAVNPGAVEAMAEIGIDISDAEPRRWSDEMLTEADVIVTMGCGDECPIVPGVRYEDWPVADPEGLPTVDVRPIREAIRQRVELLLTSLSVRSVRR